MKTVGYLIMLVGVALALYGAFVSPLAYNLNTASAPQVAQVAAQAARIGVGGVAIAALGVGIIAGESDKEPAKEEREPATE